MTSPMEAPDALLGRLKLGREEYCQRLLTMLILGGRYPRWNTRNRPVEAGYRFLSLLDELSFGEALCTAPYDFVDELDLGKRPTDLKGSAPDWAVFTDDRVWIIELKTERGSHRDAQVPTYVATGQHYYPDRHVDLTYLTGPMPQFQPELPEGTRYAHVTWEQVLPLVDEVWGRSVPEHQMSCRALRDVIDGLTTPWSTWREERLGLPPAPAEPVARLSDTPGRGADPVEKAVELARKTAETHEQGAVDVAAGSLEELREIGRAVRDALSQEEEPALAQVVPWLWNVETSTGTALTESGAEVGYELRLSWYQSAQR